MPWSDFFVGKHPCLLDKVRFCVAGESWGEAAGPSADQDTGFRTHLHNLKSLGSLKHIYVLQDIDKAGQKWPVVGKAEDNLSTPDNSGHELYPLSHQLLLFSFFFLSGDL